jgi:autotransporter translocation and assembly factor TamB
MRSKLPFLIIVIALSGMALTAISWLIYVGRQIHAQLPRILTTELEKNLDRKVAIAKIQTQIPGTVTVKNLKIANGKTFNQGTLLSVKKIDIQFSLLSILLGKSSPINSISNIRLERPHLYPSRNPKGIWNIEDLIKRPISPLAQEFQGKVQITDGTLTITDFAARLTPLPAVNEVFSISGVIDFHTTSKAFIDISGSGNPSRFSKLHIKGFWEARTQSTQLKLYVYGGSARYWSKYLGHLRTWNITSGTFNFELLLNQPHNTGLTMKGSVWLYNTRIYIPYFKLPIDKVSGSVNFTDSNITLNSYGFLGNSLIRVKGQISGTSPSRLNLLLSSNNIDFDTITSALKLPFSLHDVQWKSTGRIFAQIKGTSTQPVTTVFISIPQAVVFGIPISSAKFQGNYIRRSVTITTASTRFAGGKVTATGTIRLDPTRITVKGSATNIKLSFIPSSKPFQAKGNANFSFEVDYSQTGQKAFIFATIRQGKTLGLNFSQAKAFIYTRGIQKGYIELHLAKGVYKNAIIPTAEAKLIFSKNMLTIQHAKISTLGGIVSTYGKIGKDGFLNLNLVAENLHLSTIPEFLGNQQLTGRASLKGSLSGTIGNPRFIGTFNTRKGRFNKFDYETLNGQLEVTKRYFTIRNIQAHLPKGNVVTSGKIVIRRQLPPQLSLRVRVNDVSLQQILQDIGFKNAVYGTVNGNLDIYGIVPKVHASGTIAGKNVAVKGFSVDNVGLTISYRNGQAFITQLSVIKDSGSITGQGAIAPEGTIDINLVGKNLKLDWFSEYLGPYIDLEGPVNFVGNIQGHYQDPLIKGKISSSAPIVNHQSFDKLTSSITLSRKKLLLSNTTLIADEAIYQISALTFTPRTLYFRMTGSATSIEIAKVVSLLRNSPFLNTPQGIRLRKSLENVPLQLTGKANVSFRLSGPTERLTGTATVIGKDIRMGPNIVSNAEISLNILGSSVSKINVELKSPKIEVWGTAEFHKGKAKKVNLEITDTAIEAVTAVAESLPIVYQYRVGKIFTTFMQQAKNTTGTIDATVNLSNLQEEPTGSVTVSASRVISNGSPLGDIMVNAHLLHRKIFLDKLTITPSVGQITFSGTIHPDGEVSLEGKVNSFQLSLINPWLKAKDIHGVVNANVTIGGTTTTPTIEGSFDALNLKTGKVLINRFTTKEFTISNNTLSVVKGLIISENGKLLVSGSVPFQWSTPLIPRNKPLNLHVEAIGIDLSILSTFNQLIESAAGPLIAQMDISGSMDNPLIDGKLIIHEGKLKLSKLNSEIENITLSARFTDSKIVVEKFSCGSSMGGWLAGTGTIDLGKPKESLISAVLMLDSFQTEITKTFADELSFTVNGLLTISGNLSSPTIQGQLVVNNGHIKLPGKPIEISTTALPLPINPQMNVTFNLTRNVIVERGTLKAEILGLATLTGTIDRPILAGTVQVIQGKISYVGRKLEIVPGSIASFLLNTESPSVITLDASAKTYTLALSPFTGGITRYTLILDLSGSIGDLDIRVYSSPPGLSETEALSLLFSGTALDMLLAGKPLQKVFQEELGQILLGSAIPGLFQPLTLGELTLVLQPSLDAPLQMSVDVNLTNRLVLSYNRSLVGVTPSDLLSLSYVFSPKFAVTIQFEGRQGSLQKTTYLLEHYTRF